MTFPYWTAANRSKLHTELPAPDEIVRRRRGAHHIAEVGLLQGQLTHLSDTATQSNILH